MDEEHGRPGPLAVRSGQFDALLDALRKSLCLAGPRAPHPGSFWLGNHDPNGTVLETTSSEILREEGRGSSPGMARFPSGEPWGIRTSDSGARPRYILQGLKAQGPPTKIENHPSGAKARIHSGYLAARLKSCPFKTVSEASFSAASGGRTYPSPHPASPTSLNLRIPRPGTPLGFSTRYFRTTKEKNNENVPGK